MASGATWSCAGTNEDPLFHDLGADLADRGVLVAGAATATDRADQLAAFDKRKSSGTRDQGGIEGREIGMAGFISIVEQTGFAAEARCGPRLALRNRHRR